MLQTHLLLIAVIFNVSCLSNDNRNGSRDANINKPTISFTNELQSPSRVPDQYVLIELERTKGECPTCPVYLLSIYNDGRVVFETRQNVERLGNTEFRISEEALQRLEQKFLKNKFFLLSDRYVEGSLCPERWSDAPATRLFFRQGEKTKTVYHYEGCVGTDELERLKTLGDAIDKVLSKANE